MGCLFAIFAGMFPRLATLFIWIARPALFGAAFSGSWFWPIIGIIFLPFTTLMYVLVWPGGLSGLDVFFIILALALDLSHEGAVIYTNRSRTYNQPVPQP